MKLLVLGSKEFPLRGRQKDVGGIDFYNQSLLEELATRNLRITCIVRRDIASPHIEKYGNITVIRVPWVKGFWTKSTTFGFASFWKALSLDCDVILAHAQIATFFSVFLSKIKRVPLISIAHGLGAQQKQYGFLSGFGKKLESWAFSKPDCVVAFSKNDEKKLKSLNPKIRTAVIPTGIDLEKFTPHSKTAGRKELGLRAGEVMIRSTSRLISPKGLQYLLAGVPKLRGNFSLFLAGTGPEEKRLRNQVAAAKLDNVKFLGFRRDINELLAAADVFVLPSLSEGLPVGLLEAMASGKACVVTDIGLPVEDGVTGLAVPPKDSVALAEAIQKLIDDSKLRKRLGKHARKFVSQFTWKKTASMLIEIVKQFQVSS